MFLQRCCLNCCSQPVFAMSCFTGMIFNAISLQIVSLKIVQCNISFRPAKASSPYSHTNRRICLQRCPKEHFKVVNTSIASISCERSILDQAMLSGMLKNLFAGILTTYMETRLKASRIPWERSNFCPLGNYKAFDFTTCS